MNLLSPTSKIAISSYPFNYAVVENFFPATTASNLEFWFRELIQQARPVGNVGEGSDRHYDALNFTPVLPHFQNTSLAIIASTQMRQFIASLFGICLDENLMVGLHRHNPGSKPGWVHTDFAVVSFPNVPPNLDGTRVYWDDCGCTYSDDTKDRQPNAIKTSRAIAVLYYIGNPVWHPGMEGETGIFADAGNQLCRKVGPINNSLLAFEVSPISYHAFMGSSKHQRNSYVWWYHADPRYLLERHQKAVQHKIAANLDPWDRWTGPEIAKFI